MEEKEGSRKAPFLSLFSHFSPVQVVDQRERAQGRKQGPVHFRRDGGRDSRGGRGGGGGWRQAAAWRGRGHAVKAREARGGGAGACAAVAVSIPQQAAPLAGGGFVGQREDGRWRGRVHFASWGRLHPDSTGQKAALSDGGACLPVWASGGVQWGGARGLPPCPPAARGGRERNGDAESGYLLTLSF